MRVVLLLLGLVLGALGSAAYFVFIEDEEPVAPRPQASATPTFEQRSRLSEQISRDRAALSDQGVYLVRAALEEDCVTVSLMNPTPANVAYVEQRYAGACVQREPGAPEKQCGETTRGLTRTGTVTVPDVQDLGLAAASQRLIDAGLTFTTACLNDAKTTRWTPSAVPDLLMRVAAQCPVPGEKVRRGTEVALDANVELPGGFVHSISGMDRAAAGTDSPCGDGRNPRG